MQFDDLEKEVISSPFFQRLRRLKQLSLTDMVYPGANHTRFEHSIGVMYLASKMFDSITNNRENIKQLEEIEYYDKYALYKDRKIIRLAALLHDIGHGPFSHASEAIFPINPTTKKAYSHEDFSEAIINGPIKEIIEGNRKNNADIKCEDISSLIQGRNTKISRRLIWKPLISSQLDADRGDYLIRDSLHTGVRYGTYDRDRLIVGMRLGQMPEDEGGGTILGIEENSWHVAESLILARYQISLQVYYHKITRAYNLMLESALREMYPDGLPSPQNEPDAFLEIDDGLVINMLKQGEGGKWGKAILERNHVKCVHDAWHEHTKTEMILSELENYCNSKGFEHFKDASIRNEWYKLEQTGENDNEIMIIDEHYKANPISEYSKLIEHINSTPRPVRFYIDKDSYSDSVKNDIDEIIMRCQNE
ncbi:hypothetical protein AZH53_08555 [Methanomicrobiaceae archaeon CYW5]|nr:hypothetical protein [Methanovulcanius yangii]